jgi:hypothetical protein
VKWKKKYGFQASFITVLPGWLVIGAASGLHLYQALEYAFPEGVVGFRLLHDTKRG